MGGVGREAVRSQNHQTRRTQQNTLVQLSPSSSYANLAPGVGGGGDIAQRVEASFPATGKRGAVICLKAVIAMVTVSTMADGRSSVLLHSKDTPQLAIRASVQCHQAVVSFLMLSPENCLDLATPSLEPPCPVPRGRQQ